MSDEDSISRAYTAVAPALVEAEGVVGRIIVQDVVIAELEERLDCATFFVGRGWTWSANCQRHRERRLDGVVKQLRD